MKTEDKLELVISEAKIVKEQIEIAKSDKSELRKIAEILTLQTTSKLAMGMSGYFAEWVADQVNNNKLPETSSGSFITALRDYDGLFTSLEIGEGRWGGGEIEYEKCRKAFNEIVR